MRGLSGEASAFQAVAEERETAGLARQPSRDQPADETEGNEALRYLWMLIQLEAINFPGRPDVSDRAMSPAGDPCRHLGNARFAQRVRQRVHRLLFAEFHHQRYTAIASALRMVRIEQFWSA